MRADGANEANEKRGPTMQDVGLSPGKGAAERNQESGSDLWQKKTHAMAADCCCNDINEFDRHKSDSSCRSARKETAT